MDEISRSDQHDADRHTRWVAMWREAVRASAVPMALTELSTTRFLELSPSAAQLLGTTPAEGARLDYLSLAERPREARQVFRLAHDGMIDGIRARRRFRRPDGSMVEVESWGWVIGSPAGRALGLWAACEVRSGIEPVPVVEDVVTWASRHAGPAIDGARVTLDDRWRITEISTIASGLLGRFPAELLGGSILELSHVDDLATLIFGFARATTEARIRFPVRLLHQDGGWRGVQLVPTVVGGDGTSPFAFVVAAAPGVDERDGNAGTSDVPKQLRRIADTIEVAGMLAPLVDRADVFDASVANGLSPRQSEVLSRLTRGERVSTIAAEMFLSQSTVRNHLSTIFRRLGVHSQSELLMLLSRQAQRRV